MPDEDQAEMVAYVRDICPSCGNLRSECSDPNRVFHPQRTMCFVTATREVVLRKLEKKYGHPAPDHLTYHPTDGMQVWVALDDVNPEDNFI